MSLILLNIPFTRDLEELQGELERVIREYLQRGFDPYVQVVSEYEKIRLHIDGIVLIEREGRRGVIYMRNGENYSCYQSLQRLAEQLPPSLFVRVSGNTVVNVRYLLSLTPDEVMLSWAGQTLVRGISRRRYRELRNRLKDMAPFWEV